MNHQVIARALLAFLCACQGIATLLIDLNRTHATNPEWTGHARFHLVWQDFTVFLMSALEIALVFWPGPYGEQRFYLAAALTCIPMLAFSLAFWGRRMFDGTLSDPNGIPPVRLAIFARILEIDLNLSAEIAALIVVGVIVAIYRH